MRKMANANHELAHNYELTYVFPIFYEHWRIPSGIESLKILTLNEPAV